MTDIKLFYFDEKGAFELDGKAAMVEKDLQQLIERHMKVFLGVRFLASEYGTGIKHRGRIDSLGLDENNCPVIVEYKRHHNENVINQGLFYLDWLLDHKAEFKWLVMEKLGKDVAKLIEWNDTRLLCIAGDFTRYDQHAVAQINRSIELIRYKLFGSNRLLLELVNYVASNNEDQAKPIKISSQKFHHERLERLEKNQLITSNAGKVRSADKTFTEQLACASSDIVILYQKIRSLILAQGDDVIEKPLKLYTAFRRLKNFVCARVQPKKDPHVLLILKLKPKTVYFEEGFSRNVSLLGHWGTGEVELKIRDLASFDKARLLIERAYQEN